MKRFFFLLLLAPLLSAAQKIKMNSYDKFIQKRRVESFPVTVKTAPDVKLSLAFYALDSVVHLRLSGSGTGTNSIGLDHNVIFLFDDESTLTVKPIGLQTFEIGATEDTYKHDYFISLSDLDKLRLHNLEGIRKYHSKGYNDIYIPKENTTKVKKLTALFLEEYKIAKERQRLQPIQVKDIARHIGDSVVFTSKISNGRFLPSTKDSLTVLQVAGAPEDGLTVVIRGADRKNFGAEPEKIFTGKQARIRGKVELVKSKPQITISKKEQLLIMEDTVKVAAAKVVVPQKAPPEKKEATKEQAPKTAPAFPGGHEVWMSFLNRNLKPPAALTAGEKKTVVVQFLVSADGAPNNFKIMQSAGAPFDEEALRVLKRMPKWKAGIENGRPTEAMVTQPITFFRTDTSKRKEEE